MFLVSSYISQFRVFFFFWKQELMQLTLWEFYAYQHPELSTVLESKLTSLEQMCSCDSFLSYVSAVLILKLCWICSARYPFRSHFFTATFPSSFFYTFQFPLWRTRNPTFYFILHSRWRRQSQGHFRLFGNPSPFGQNDITLQN